MDEYILFLDESGLNPKNKYFCVAGFIISRQTYEDKIVKSVEELKVKNNIPHDIPLHYVDIKNSNGYFSIYKSEDGNLKRSMLLTDIVNLLHESDITTIGCYCHEKNFKKQFKNFSHNDLYGIMLKKIMEQYTMFLIENKAKGSIYIESRTFSEDQFLQNIFTSFLNNGSDMFDSDITQNHLKTITFVIKRDVSSGIQLADFIPVGFLREINTFKNKYNLQSTIYEKLYKRGTSYEKSLGLLNYMNLDDIK